MLDGRYVGWRRRGVRQFHASTEMEARIFAKIGQGCCSAPDLMRPDLVMRAWHFRALDRCTTQWGLLSTKRHV